MIIIMQILEINRLRKRQNITFFHLYEQNLVKINCFRNRERTLIIINKDVNIGLASESVLQLRLLVNTITI